VERMELPLMLAGPILRRVEPTLVSVWVALSEPGTIRVTLWEGRVTAGSANPLIAFDPLWVACKAEISDLTGPKLRASAGLRRFTPQSPCDKAATRRA